MLRNSSIIKSIFTNQINISYKNIFKYFHFCLQHFELQKVKYSSAKQPNVSSKIKSGIIYRTGSGLLFSVEKQ